MAGREPGGRHARRRCLLSRAAEDADLWLRDRDLSRDAPFLSTGQVAMVCAIFLISRAAGAR